MLDAAERHGLDVVSPALLEGANDYDFAAFAPGYCEKMKDELRRGWFHGVCFAIRRSVFHRIGYPDTDRLMWGHEDKEYLVRCLRAGIPVGTVGGSVFHHFGSITQAAMKREQNIKKLGDHRHAYRRMGMGWWERKKFKSKQRQETAAWLVEHTPRWHDDAHAARKRGMATAVTQAPITSILLLAYNQRALIRDAVRSVLEQEGPPIEILLSDDASTDGTFDELAALARSYQGPHQVIARRNHRNLGIGEHLNTLVRESRGELLVVAAGDDISEPTRARSLQEAWLNSDRKLDLIATPLTAMSEDGGLGATIAVDDLAKVAQRGRLGGTQTLCRRSGTRLDAPTLRSLRPPPSRHRIRGPDHGVPGHLCRLGHYLAAAPGPIPDRWNLGAPKAPQRRGAAATAPGAERSPSCRTAAIDLRRGSYAFSGHGAGGTGSGTREAGIPARSASVFRLEHAGAHGTETRAAHPPALALAQVLERRQRPAAHQSGRTQSHMSSSRRSLRLSFYGSGLVQRFLRWLGRRLPGAGRTAPSIEVVFVTAPLHAQGWILDAICREIAQRLPNTVVRMCPAGTELPLARRYFFSHYMYYIQALSPLSPVYRGRSFVFATHLEPSKHGIDNHTLARLLDGSDGIICMNLALSRELAALGVAPDRLNVEVGAADPRLYQPHTRQPDGKVGFCSAFYERKSPDLILEIVRRLPHRKFVLLGRSWQKYKRFTELLSLPNFEYVEANYTDYPRYYAQMSVFVSASDLEGGPIPLLEAMMSNAVPVASTTGFAPDIIKHGRNGFLFPVGAAADTARPWIEEAFALRCDVHDTVRHCSWDDFATRVGARMGLSPATFTHGHRAPPCQQQRRQPIPTTRSAASTPSAWRPSCSTQVRRCWMWLRQWRLRAPPCRSLPHQGHGLQALRDVVGAG